MARALPKIAVLMGGVSPEHAVSLRSGHAILETLIGLSPIRPVSVLLDFDGAWSIDQGPPLTAEAAAGALRDMEVGCCFLALHGSTGEDGTVQGFLETVGLAYTGSGVRASAIAMSKSLTRAVLCQAGLPMAPGIALPVGALLEGGAELLRSFRFPAFLKDDRSGSSIGVHLVAEQEALTSLLSERDPARLVVLEQAIQGLEASVAVLGNRGPRAEHLCVLPPVEIRSKRSFFDLQAKYDPSLAEETCPPRESTPQQVLRLQELARKVHHLIGCDGASRTDFILGPEGPVILECNTLPGMTPESLLPLEARAGGLDFSGLVRRLVELALELEGARC